MQNLLAQRIAPPHSSNWQNLMDKFHNRQITVLLILPWYSKIVLQQIVAVILLVSGQLTALQSRAWLLQREGLFAQHGSVDNNLRAHTCNGLAAKTLYFRSSSSFFFFWCKIIKCTAALRTTDTDLRNSNEGL